MTTFSYSPWLAKGAIVGIDPFNPWAGIIVFQYNPKTMTRRLEASARKRAERGAVSVSLEVGF